MKMIEAIHHRGPDDRGVFLQAGVALAHARLSIIDLSPAGHQPMANDDGSVQIIFNGEIYNYKMLREGLERSGKHRFKSHSDTEVILALYEEVGEKVFERLNGMFAIAIYDFRRKKLILARDRMGKKPVYWGVFGKTVVFGSEMKAMLKHPLVSRTLDLESVNKYLAYEYVPTPHSIFKGISKLEPATYLTYKEGVSTKTVFWHPDFTDHPISWPDALARLDTKLAEATRSRLVASDVPVGIFLSGGIDSSTVAYYAARSSTTKVKTFSMTFAEPSFDESSYAKRVAHHLGTEHHEEAVTARDLLSVIHELGNIIDEPLADASIVPTYLLSRFTRTSVKVALGGDGGDELFAGYPTFQAERLARVYQFIPEAIRRSIITPMIASLRAKDTNFSFDFRLKKFIDGFRTDSRYRHLRWLGSFGHEARQELFRPMMWDSLAAVNEYSDADRYLAEVKRARPESRLLYLYLRMYLMDCVLVKVDRASMKSSLEVRSPFLDHHVVEFVSSLPYEFKCRGFSTKYILKQLMKGKLPQEIVARPKKGFGIPLARWFNSELKEFLNDVLSVEATNAIGLFEHAAVDALKREHFTHRRDNRKELWTLLIFYLWHERWVRGLKT